MSGPIDALRHLNTVGVVAQNSPDYVRHMLRLLKGDQVSVPLRMADDGERLDQTSTTEIIQPADDSGWLSVSFTSVGGDQPAQISFTSGTQSAPKAVLLSRGNLDFAVRHLSSATNINDEIREYVGAPVFHVFGYGRCRTIMNAGGSAYIPPNGFDLVELRNMLRAGEVNALSTVPSLWRLIINAHDQFGTALEQIRWAEIGGQFMAPSEKRQLKSLLPNAVILQHYGLTEATRTALLRVDTAADRDLESVGEIAAPAQVRINNNGRIEIKGPNVALGISGAHGWDVLGENAWYETSDHGHVQNGHLFFDGRADDVINCGGIKISPDQLEDAIRRQFGPAPAPKFGVYCAPHTLRGETIGIVMERADAAHQATMMDVAIDQAAQFGVHARDAISITLTDSLPLTHTGKLQRALLKKNHEQPSENPPPPADAATAPNDAFTENIRALLGDMYSPSTRLRDLEIDSLSFIQLTMIAETALGKLPENWEDMRMDELIERADTPHVPPTEQPRIRARAYTPAPPLNDGTKNQNPDGISFWALVKEDFRANDRSLTHQGFWMLFIHRFGNWRMGIKNKFLRLPFSLVYRVFNKLTQIFFGMKLDYVVKVGRRVRLEHFGGMILGAREIGNDVIIRQNTTFGVRSVSDLNAKPIIGDFVQIGAGAVIVGNVTIGENSVIGANSVVSTDVAPNSIMLGVPAKYIRKNMRRNPSPLDLPKS